VMAGQVGVRDHVHIGQGAQLGAQCGVRKDVPDGEKCLGTPAISVRDFGEITAIYHKLPELRRQVRQLAKAIEELRRASSGEARQAA
jgi:UDP-3-O-[3-hydroxymyristoyl] glucosamine N-acyltransferase